MSYYKLENYLTTNFQLKEFVVNQEQEFLNLPFSEQSKMVSYFLDIAKKLEVFRAFIGNKAVIISSSFRSFQYNIKAGGRPKSLHLLGLAVDLHFSGISIKYMSKLQELFGSVIYYKSDRFFHVDLRNKYLGWSNWVDVVN